MPRHTPLSGYLIVSVFILLSAGSAFSAETALDALGKEAFGLAIKGYDSVAYFTEGKAVKGSEEYSYTWNEAVWQFSSAEHRKMFAADPVRYVPHRGGW